ncbi:MAG: hypothetical protein ABIK89_21325 [Planctomycetota bacterium]
MFRDPIVKEIQQYRQQYAAQFNHDIDAICEDIRCKQEESGRKVVSRKPRRATTKPKDQPAA